MEVRVFLTVMLLIGGVFLAGIGIENKAEAAGAVSELKPPRGVASPTSSERLKPNVPKGCLDLNGSWHFRTDPENKGLDEKWFVNPGLEKWGTIHVPGSWQAQGWGADGSAGSVSNERFQLTFYGGPGWYGRTFKLPKAWNGKQVWLNFDRASTLAQVWVNGQSAGEHIGTWSSFVLPITDFVHKDGDNTIVVRVEEKPGHWSTGFASCIALHFGGLWQPVSAYATGPIHIDDVSALPCLAKKQVRIEATLGASASKDWRIVCRVYAPNGSKVSEDEMSLTGQNPGDPAEPAGLRSVLTIPVPDPLPWSPDSPSLYSAEVQVFADGKLSDSRKVRFGMRDVTRDGQQVLLNGEPLFVRGVLHWGYYPNLITIDPSEAQIRKEFSDLRAAGFNTVKVCLFVMPKRFYEIADETGMLIWQEYPMWQTVPNQDAKAAFLEFDREYAEWIRADRNHASVILRSLTCEAENANTDLLGRLYNLAKSMTGGALVGDNGAYIVTIEDNIAHRNQTRTDWYDYHIYKDVDEFYTFLPRLAQELRQRPEIKPYLSGEDLDCDTYRDTAAIRNKWMIDGKMPWWLNAYQFLQQERVETDLVKRHGSAVIGELVRRQNTRALLMRKAYFEVFRSYPELSGYIMTGIRDITLTSPGFYDDLDKTKWPADEWRRFNSDQVLILHSKRRSFSFRRDEPVSVTIDLSNFGANVENAPLSWRLVSGDQTLAQGEATVNAQRGQIVTVAQCDISVSNVPGKDFPMSCKFIAELGKNGVFTRNEWNIWFFPSDSPYNPSTVMVTDHMDKAVLKSLTEGARVLYLPKDDDNVLPRFVQNPTGGGFWRESAIWLPSGHPALGRFPHANVADLQFLDMTQRHPFDLGALRSEISPIIWGLNPRIVPDSIVDYMFEARVGKGSLLACCLKLGGSDNVAGNYLMANLIRYAESDKFNPTGGGDGDLLRLLEK